MSFEEVPQTQIAAQKLIENLKLILERLASRSLITRHQRKLIQIELDSKNKALLIKQLTSGEHGIAKDVINASGPLRQSEVLY